MPRSTGESLRWPLTLLLIAILWYILGAPLTAADWRSLPGIAVFAWSVLPERLAHLCSLWLLV